MVVCIHGKPVVGFDGSEECDGKGCDECNTLGLSPTYDPNCTVQDLEELLCNVPMVVMK